MSLRAGSLLAAALVLGSLTAPAAAAPDFRNFVYKPQCNDKEPIRVRRGAAENDTIKVAVADVVRGDISGDGKPEYVVVLACDAKGGTGRWTEAYLYQVAAGKPVLVTSLPSGDRAHGGLVSVAIEAGKLVVERDSTSDGACCTEWQLTRKFKLVGAKLREVGLGERSRDRDGEPLTVRRVRFAKGTSSATIKRTTIVGDEHVLAARGGQKLTAKLTVKKGAGRIVVFDEDGFYPLTIGEDEATSFSGTRESAGHWRVLVVPLTDADDAEIVYSLSLAIE